MDWTKEKSNLENAIKRGVSYEQLGREYNVSGTYIRKIASKLNITLPKRRKINPKETFNKGKGEQKYCIYCNSPITNKYSHTIFCSLKCSTEHKKEQHYRDYLKNQKDYLKLTSMQWIKPHILKEQNNKCAICGISNIWNNKSLIFILDHIDGKASNNLRDNLRLICPNCDSQLDTYKSKNKNSDRIYYHYHHR